MTLIVTTAPHEDESGFGYYRRLAAENQFWSWRDVASVAGVARLRTALFVSPDHIASVLGLERAWSRFAVLQEKASRAWRGLRRSRGDAVCPLCLEESGYLRNHWEHGFSVACAHHRVLLLDRCTMCSQPLSTDRPRIDSCRCGGDLRGMKTQPCTDAQRWLSSLIATNGHSTQGASPVLRRVDPKSLALLVRTLCLFADPFGPPPRRNSASPQSVAEAAELLQPLERLLYDWPRGFEVHVAERIAAGKKDARTLNNLLGSWYAHLRRACQDKALEPFLASVIRVAAREFDGALGLDAANQLVAQVTEHYRSSEAAVAIGVSRDMLVQAIKRGDVQHRTSRFGTRGLVYEVPKAEVERIRAQRDAWCSESIAAESAGVPVSVLRNMMSAKVIESDASWRHDLCKGGLVARQSLSELLSRLNRSVRAKPAGGEELLSWAELTSRRLGDRRAIQAAMSAASAGRLTAVRPGTRVGDVQFRRADVQKFFGTPLLEAGMSLHQLAKATGWKWESIAHWIDEGLLEYHSITLRGQPCRVVAPEQLLRFRQTYVPLADLARSAGTTSTALASQLDGLDVVGAKVLPNGARRGGLLRMSDLCRKAMQEASQPERREP